MSDETLEARDDKLEAPGAPEDEVEEEDELEEPAQPPRRVHIPRPIAWAVLAALAALLILTSLWGLSRGTLTYGLWYLDADTASHVRQVYDELAAAGAPEVALRRLAVATQPGVNVGNAVEAIRDAEKALAAISERPAIASALRRLEGIYTGELCPHLWYGPCRQLVPRSPASPVVTPILP